MESLDLWLVEFGQGLLSLDGLWERIEEAFPDLEGSAMSTTPQQAGI